MKRIYIAGPYRAGAGTQKYATETQKRKNIDQARDAAAGLYRKGWAPFCPHSMTAHFELIYHDIEREVYLATDLAWLAQCDAIFLLKGWSESDGAVKEYQEALRLGLRIFGGSVELMPRGDDTVAKPPEAEEAEVVQNIKEMMRDFPVENDDAIHHPPHYTQGKMECVAAIEGLGLPFHEAQILKYLVRWRYKNGLEDLQKAEWYLMRLMELNA